MLFLLIFIAVPIIEIAAFIKIGDLIGLWPTIACIIFTAVAGTVILRQQGLHVLRQAQEAMQRDQLPVDSVINGAFLLIAGALLLTPGFFTDAIGFILLIPPARVMIAKFVWNRLRGKVHIYQSGMRTETHSRGSPHDRRGPIIEGEAVEIKTTNAAKNDNDADATPPGKIKPSPWNK